MRTLKGQERHEVTSALTYPTCFVNVRDNSDVSGCSQAVKLVGGIAKLA